MIPKDRAALIRAEFEREWANSNEAKLARQLDDLEQRVRALTIQWRAEPEVYSRKCADELDDALTGMRRGGQDA